MKKIRTKDNTICKKLPEVLFNMNLMIIILILSIYFVTRTELSR